MNIDIVLFAGRIVLVALLYIFLFAVMKTGVDLCAGSVATRLSGRSMWTRVRAVSAAST